MEPAICRSSSTSSNFDAQPTRRNNSASPIFSCEEEKQ
jgi:hypothetical protein